MGSHQSSAWGAVCRDSTLLRVAVQWTWTPNLLIMGSPLYLQSCFCPLFIAFIVSFCFSVFQDDAGVFGRFNPDSGFRLQRSVLLLLCHRLLWTLVTDIPSQRPDLSQSTGRTQSVWKFLWFLHIRHTLVFQIIRQMFILKYPWQICFKKKKLGRGQILVRWVSALSPKGNSKKLFVSFSFFQVQNGLAVYATWTSIASLINFSVVLHLWGVDKSTAATASLCILFAEVVAW